jgi:serine/threonine-protein kinase
MARPPKAEPSPKSLDPDRLVQALLNRGLVSQEELRQAQGQPDQNARPEDLLTRLVSSRALTGNQAKRVYQELSYSVGPEIPGYQLLEKLGQGSMGIVFKGRQLSMNRLVAIKVLKPKLAANPKDLERFLQEAHLAAKLSHNNIIQAIDAGSAGKIHYFVMEYVEGTPISQQIDAGKVFSEAEALEIILQIAHAIDHANRRHLIHRDIKPANIVITKEGVAKLADLGLARQTSGDALAQEEKGTVRGTPFYIAPEQIRGFDDIDVRADIYSLGATLYHMVTGRPPFRGKTINAIFDGHLREELTPPDHLNTTLSAGLGEVVEFMMAKDRRQRYPSPEELITDLESLKTGEPPKFARQKIQASMLEQLAEGETADDDESGDRHAPRGPNPLWLAVLGSLLGVSVVLNLVLLILLLRR